MCIFLHTGPHSTFVQLTSRLGYATMGTGDEHENDTEGRRRSPSPNMGIPLHPMFGVSLDSIHRPLQFTHRATGNPRGALCLHRTTGGIMKTITRFVIILALLAPAASACPHRFASPTGDCGMASWYGSEWTTNKAHPRRGTMANGQRFNPRALTAASFAYPLGSTLSVTNEANGRQITVKVTDRGPAMHLGRLLDLSQAAAEQLGYTRQGLTYVSVRVVSAPKR